MKKISIANESLANYSFGGGFTIKPGENILELAQWSEIKNLRHVRARVRAGVLVEGETFNDTKKKPKKKLEEIKYPAFPTEEDPNE